MIYFVKLLDEKGNGIHCIQYRTIIETNNVHKIMKIYFPGFWTECYLHDLSPLFSLLLLYIFFHLSLSLWKKWAIMHNQHHKQVIYSTLLYSTHGKVKLSLHINTFEIILSRTRIWPTRRTLAWTFSIKEIRALPSAMGRLKGC